MSDDDLRWMEALAGRDSAESPTGREARALREALRSGEAPEPAAVADARRERALLDRAAREGLLPAHRALAQRWPLALAASLVIALGLGLALREPSTPTQSIERGAEDGVVRITAANPAALKQTLLRELRAAGVDANGYEALNVHGIDADLPSPLSESVRRVLRSHDIPEPADGVLRIEIRSRE